MKKKLLSIIASGIFLIMITTPICLIYLLSSSEIKKYSEFETVDFVEKAYGEIYAAERRNIQEYYVVSGSFEESKIEFIELSRYKNVRLIVTEGEEIFEGEIIGWYSENKTIESSLDGIIKSINEEDKYIQLVRTDEVSFKCYVDNEIAEEIKKYEDTGFETENMGHVDINKISNVQSEGQVCISISFEEYNGVLGEEIKELKLLTDKIYKDVLVLPKDCVYQKNIGGEYCVRVVDIEGNYLREDSVSIGYSNDEYICVTGIDEGTLCDAGYKYIVDTPVEE